MATDQSPKEPAETTAQAPPTPTVFELLDRGFDSLTLNPAPRLRATRQRLENQDPIREAWKDVGRAMTDAIRSVGSLIKTNPIPWPPPGFPRKSGSQ